MTIMLRCPGMAERRRTTSRRTVNEIRVSWSPSGSTCAAAALASVCACWIAWAAVSPAEEAADQVLLDGGL